MKDVALTLRMYLGSDAPEGPGWYIYATGETPLIPATKIAPQAADIIGQAFQQVTDGLGITTITPGQIIGSGNHLVRQRLRQELEFAEAQAQRIKTLRQSLQALDETPGTVEEPSERQE